MPLLTPMGFISAERVGRTGVWWHGFAPRDVSSFIVRDDSQVIRANECVVVRVTGEKDVGRLRHTCMPFYDV